MKHVMKFILLGFFMIVAPALMANQSVVKKKSSLAEIGKQGIENLKTISAGYGTKICKDKVKTKDDLVKIAWPGIRHTCGKFTFGMMKKFTDDPSVIYSLCTFTALKVCQQKIGIEKPCERVETCREQLGIPRKGE